MRCPGNSGRPTKYEESWVTKLEDAMHKGYTVEMFCHENRIAISTFYEWRKLYPDFSKAYNAGNKDAEGHWQFYIVNNLENKKLNTNALKMLMFNCFGWSDKKDSEITLSQKDEVARVVREAECIYKIEDK